MSLLRLAIVATVALACMPPAPARAADCDVVRGVVRRKALPMVVSYPGGGQGHFTLEVDVGLVNNARTDLQGPTPPIDESEQPRYCNAIDWWAKKLFVATEGKYRLRRADFWEVDGDQDRGNWTTLEAPFPVWWQLGHVFNEAFWPRVLVDQASPILFSDFPILCTAERFVNPDGTFAPPPSYRCDAGLVGVDGDFGCDVFTGGAFCVDGGDVLDPSARWHGSVLHHEGGHFLFGLPDENDKGTGHVACFSEFEQDDNAACGGEAKTAVFVPDGPLDPVGGATSVMSIGFRDHFCDATTHLQGLRTDSTDAGGGAAISRNESLSFELNPPMWEILREFAPGLDNDVHTDGVFGTVDYDDLPDVECVFHGNVVQNDPLIVLDRSFSMSFSSDPDPGYTALDAAKEAAANLYNLVPDGIHAGVTAYNTGFQVPVPYAPVDFDAPQDGKITVEGDLPFGPNGNTDIIQAIEEGRDIILQAQEDHPGQLSGAMILLSDGLPNVPEDFTPAQQRSFVLLAALSACVSGDPPIAIHTLAFGDADEELLAEIANVCNGQLRVNGGNRAALETPLDYKESLARMGYDVRGRKEVTHLRQVLSAASQEQPFWVPESSADLEFTWLGKPHAFKPGSAPGSPLAECDFEELDFALRTPGGVLVPASTASPVGDLELGYGARTARRSFPEPGFWTARVEAPPNCVATMPEIVWIGNVRNGLYQTTLSLSEPVAPRNVPVTVEARLYYADSLVTDVFVGLLLLNQGNAELVVPVDDGSGADAEAGDGVYTATFSPLLGGQPSGGLTVRALWLSLGGFSRAVPRARDPVVDGIVFDPTADPLPVPGTAVLLDEATLVRRDCCVPPLDSTVGCARICPRGVNLDLVAPELDRGTDHDDVEVQVCGLPLVPERVQAGFGPGVRTAIRRTSYDPETGCGTLAFEASVRPDAPVGPRGIRVESGGALLRGDGALTVCTADRRPVVEPEEVHVGTCGKRAWVELPVPAASPACGEDREIALEAALRIVGGRPLRKERRLDPERPVVHLPVGRSKVVWRGTDVDGVRSGPAAQHVTVFRREKADCCDVNGDRVVDLQDREAVGAALDTSVEPGDPRDVDADGAVTAHDLAACRP